MDPSQRLWALGNTGHDDNLFEPIPLSVSRSRSHSALLHGILEESVRFLFEEPISNGSGTQPTLPPFDSAITTEPQGVASLRSTLPSAMSSGLLAIPTKFNHATRSFAEVPVAKRQRAANANKGTHKGPQFRVYQEDQWEARFSELLEFKARHGHCDVPHPFHENPALGTWVKRQRYQYKLKIIGRRRSTMTEHRIEILEKAGLVWNLQTSTWETRLRELQEYLQEHGDCIVPTHYATNKALASWVKSQRKQYKMFRDGKASSMTAERISQLDMLGFTWELRGTWQQHKEKVRY